jgi:hypothetical protein
VHVALATFSWLAVLWSIAAAGSLVPRAREVTSPDERDALLHGPLMGAEGRLQRGAQPVSAGRRQ